MPVPWNLSSDQPQPANLDPKLLQALAFVVRDFLPDRQLPRNRVFDLYNGTQVQLTAKAAKGLSQNAEVREIFLSPTGTGLYEYEFITTMRFEGEQLRNAMRFYRPFNRKRVHGSLRLHLETDLGPEHFPDITNLDLADLIELLIQVSTMEAARYEGA